METITVKLERPEKVDKWYLWQVADKVAGRWTPIFCAPSVASVYRQFEELKQKHNGKPGDFSAEIIASMENGDLVVLHEELT